MNPLPPRASASLDKLPRARRWRMLPWAALVALLLAAQTLLIVLALHYREARTQDDVEAKAAVAVTELEQLLAKDLRDVIAMPSVKTALDAWRERAAQLLASHEELLRVEHRDAAMKVVEAIDTRTRAPLFGHLTRDESQLETELACGAAQRRGGPTYSHSYFVPQHDGRGLEVMDLCVAEHDGERVTGFTVASYSLPGLLDQISVQSQAPGHDLSFVEADGTRLALGRMHVGAGVYRASRLIDLPGTTMQLRIDSAAARPSLVPDLVTGLVIGLSLTLFGVVVLLARDVRRRARAEAALADALAFRKAMEDSVVTGLRARDLSGRTTYVNPAFCSMVGYAPDELVDRATPPYWPPDQLDDYRSRQDTRLASTPATHTRETYETVFVRLGGERFPAMVFEAPLLDAGGRHTGWMSAVLDLSAQRRVEEVARQQQERLQATARLATAGEMASLLSHELNQPLSAIAAYASGSLNMLKEPPGSEPYLMPMLQQAAQRIAEQAERAGRVIKSVHDFVRRREHARESVGVDALIDAVLPLVRLQARKSDTRVEIDLGAPAPKVVCDRAMVEQVLLNLTRNGIQAMAPGDGEHAPLLTLRATQTHAQWVRISVGDRGPGVDDAIARQLYTPFFTTRSDGMGLGLSVCRTIVEQHGGALDFANLRDERGRVCGAEFSFTLPAFVSASTTAIANAQAAAVSAPEPTTTTTNTR